MPYDTNTRWKGYLHPFIEGTMFTGGVGEFPRKLVELAMCRMSADIRSCSGWRSEYRDPESRQQWKEESLGGKWIVSVGSKEFPVKLSERQVDYVLDELSGYASLTNETGRCQASCFDRIWQSTEPLNDSTLEDFNHQISLLRDRVVTRSSSSVSPSPQIHSTSNPTTSASDPKPFTTCHDPPFHYLIDPHKPPLIYNKTLSTNPLLYPPYQPHPPPYSNHRNVLDPEPAGEAYGISFKGSHKYALIPTDFSIKAGEVTPLSYINDLYPSLPSSHQTQTLTQHITTTLHSFLPLFSATLTSLHRLNPLPHRIPGSPRYTEWSEPSSPEDSPSDDEQGWEEYRKRLRTWEMERPVCLPDLPEGRYRGGLEERRWKIDLMEGEKVVQVVVSLSEVILDSEHPKYMGTPWHVAGLRNERIVSCGVYICACENITTPNISFRMATVYPQSLQAGDISASLRTYGLSQSTPCHQHLGSVPLSTPGFALTFPNIYQHRFEPFELATPGRQGRLTILELWLVDPELRDSGEVVSTSRIPVQRKEWVRRVVGEVLDERVPIEVVEKIVGAVKFGGAALDFGGEGLMEEEEVERWAKEMKEERRRAWDEHDKEYFCIPFDGWSAIYGP
ncbi:hypothetical protein JAAARDRAFT_41409 [Jaapia argillacea MUCL 33604]|uniref:DUF4246 domain-containing protein n=1 Tax=Jaapia argillacea MUCL 33604 TaxID=933084 RepID=A0A067P8B1_9AGAM|nr:hypothetical protein JAAARDRAFT_41409 [Jaapia argillacea MUCL 33604]